MFSSPTKPGQFGIHSTFLEVMALQKWWLAIGQGIMGLKSFNLGMNFIKLGL